MSGPLRGHDKIAKATCAVLAALCSLPLLPARALAHPPAILNSNAEKAVAEEITAFRKLLADTIRSKDAAKLKEMYTRSFVHTDETGKRDDRDTRIADAVRGRSIIETADVSGLVIRIPNDWTAIATGTSRVGSTTSSTSYAVRWMAVYVRTEKFWALAASQATRTKETN